MITISLCMIVKDEEDVLERCLSSVKDIADEIIIVDTGSSDKTKEIAGMFTDRIFDFAWIDDFAAARNESFSKASMEYVMWLDADDVIEEEDRAAFMRLKKDITDRPDVIMMKYHVAFGSDGKPTFSYYRERLLKRSRGFLWNGEVHEAVTPSGTIQYIDIAVCHRKLHPAVPGRNLHIYEALIAKGKVLEARQQFYYARELYYNGRYEQAAVQFEEFLASGRGWLENQISACRDLAACLTKLSKDDDALRILFQSFTYDLPRAEVCCDIGSRFLKQNLYKAAAYWYERAAECEMDETTGGFYEKDCYGYIPYMQLCVCYDKLGNLTKAEEWNDKAGVIRPEDPAYLYNKAYFDRKRIQAIS